MSSLSVCCSCFCDGSCIYFSITGELKSKLGPECPKMVRMYGSAIEAKDYPVPRGDLRSTRGMRDLRCDPCLQVGLNYSEGIQCMRNDGRMDGGTDT